MINNDFLTLKDNDFEVLKDEVKRIKKTILQLVSLSPKMTVEEFYKFNKENENLVENILYKYNFFATNFQSEEILNTLNEMNKFVIENFKEIDFNKDYYNFIKKLIVEDEEDLYYKEKKIKSFEDNGIHLSKEKQEEIIKISKKLTEYQSSFTKNILNAKKEFIVEIDKNTFMDLSEDIKSLFDENYKLKYSQPSIMRILKNCDSDKLRRSVYIEDQKISNKGTNFDNSDNIKNIVLLKNTKSKILGYKNTGEQVLKDTMAGNIDSAYSLLEQMRNELLPIAKKEEKELENFAKINYGIEKVDFSNRNFIMERIKSKKFDYIFEEEKKYLTVENILEASFELIENMYGVNLTKIEPIFKDLDNKDLLYFKSSEDGKDKGVIILDLYERNNKKNGAWVTNYIANTKKEKGFQVLNTNFKKGEGVSFEQFRTLLHEMGHLVHGIVSNTKYSNVSGTRGLPRDAVEIPSMTMEKFAYKKDLLLKATNNKMPTELINKANKIKNFMVASFYTRQVGISMYDLKIFNSENVDIYNEYKKNMDYATGIKYMDNSNFPMVFTHIFSGGYSSGYYGYLWSEVYAADMFSILKKDPMSKGKEFKEKVLSHGGSKNSQDLYEKLLNRPVKVEKFNDYLGLTKTKKTKNLNI